VRTGQRGPGRVKRGSRIACVGLGRSGTSVGPPAGRGAGCAAAGECGRTLVTGWGCRGGRREYAGDVGRVLVDCQPTCPQGLIPSRIRCTGCRPGYRLPRSLSPLATGLQAAAAEALEIVAIDAEKRNQAPPPLAGPALTYPLLTASQICRPPTPLGPPFWDLSPYTVCKLWAYLGV